jgi:hypothetical protein
MDRGGGFDSRSFVRRWLQVRFGQGDGAQVKVEMYQKDNELDGAVAMAWPGNRKLKGFWCGVASGDAWGKCRC